MTLPPHNDARAALTAAAAERILVLDGAMGTMIQQLKLDEAGYRGERFKDWIKDVRGNNDLLILTQADAIRAIHLQYFLAGADICETNTFSSTSIVQADYGMEALAYELNVAGARLAKEAAQLAFETDGKRRFVAGALGRSTRRRRCRPTSTIRATATSPSTRSPSPMPRRSTG